MKMMKTGLCIVAASCLFVQGLVAEPKLVVSGIVTDTETGNPIEGAKVTDDNYGPEPRKGATTDAEGKYRYTTWGEEHNVLARASGYEPQLKLLTTSPLQTREENVLNFELSPQASYSTPVSVLLEQGIYTEETVGDRTKAIEIYTKIVADDQANRKYVAEALFRMGRCYVEEGQSALALEELRKLIDQFPEQEKMVARAKDMIAELTPKPLFPELVSCRLKYPVALKAGVAVKARHSAAFDFYQTDIMDLSWSVNNSLQAELENFEVILIPEEGSARGTVELATGLPGSVRSIPSYRFDEVEPGEYTLQISGSQDDIEVVKALARIQIKPVMYAQLGLDEIMPNLDIHFISAQQNLNDGGTIQTRGFINSDFIHIEKMVDGNGDEVEFTETHEGNIYRYRATLNKPVAAGEVCLLGNEGWKEGMVKRVPGSAHEYSYRMHHTPGTDSPTRRVDIFRLPQGAELIETTPANLPYHVRNGQVELLVDTIIPQGGSLLTEFSYRLSMESEKYVTQINELKKNAGTEEQRDALDQIAVITGRATFHQGALVQLAGIAAGASFNHQRVVTAAELASQFGYHTGALIEVAKVAANANHESTELDEILELVVLKLGGTPSVVNLAREAVAAETDTENAEVRDAIAAMKDSADYQTLEAAMEGQKSRFDSTGKSKPLTLEPAPWKNGDTMRYRLLTKTGMEMGHLIWAVNSVEHEGKACWKVEQRLVIPAAGTIMASHVVAEKESFIPLSGRTVHQLGTVDTAYLPGKVLLRSNGAESPREVKVSNPIYDNDQVIFLMRRLPLAEKFSTSFPIMVMLSGASGLECRIRVMDRENIEVSSETYDCWKIRIQVYMGAMKAVEQTAWFSVKGHIPVRFVTDQMDMELVEQIATTQERMALKEHGAVLNLPKGWLGYELPSVGKGSEIVRLLPPEMKLEGMLCKTVRQPASINVREIAKKDVEVLKGYFKNYTVRADTVAEKEINGMSAKTFAAGYEDQGKAKVEYRAYYVTDSRVFWFVFRVDADQFDAVKSELDELIEGLKTAE